MGLAADAAPPARPPPLQLGAPQRKWLRGVLESSAAPLKLVASGSVLAGTIGQLVEADKGSYCDGDDWACWPRAQVMGPAAGFGGCVTYTAAQAHPLA